MNKKGLAWETFGKIVLALAVLLILLGVIFVLSGKMDEVWQRIVNIFTFGG